MEREQEDRAATYEGMRQQKIAKNIERLNSLTPLVDQVAALRQSKPEKKRKKRSLDENIPESSRVLRPRANGEIMVVEQEDEGNGENMAVDQEDEGHVLDEQKKKTHGRKRTRMVGVFDRSGQPPVPVSFNERGQPDGNNASEFNNFIATHVKSHIPLGHADWRLVPVEKKNGLMTELKKYYVVDDKLKDYVMGSAHKKWKDFKADLKERIYKEDRTEEELYDLFKEDTRVTPIDVKWLIEFWQTEQAKKRSEQGKKNREKQKVLHTSGSKSHARITSEMHKENGYAPRRDEVFIRTHQSKKKPQTQETIAVINKIEDAINDHPELLEKTIQQGDVLAHVLGKEKNGYVRCVGLGPSAGTIGMLGAQRLKSTKLQMAELEAEKAWRANELLKEQVDEISNNAKSQKSQIDALIEEVSQLRMMVSQSNSGNNNSMVNLNHEEGEGESADWDEEQQFQTEEERLDQEIREATEKFERMKARAKQLHNKKEATLRQNRVVAQREKSEAAILEKKRKEIELQNEKVAEDLQKKEADQMQKKKEAEQLRKKKELEQQQKKEQVQAQKKLGVAITQKNHQQGNMVTLYNVFRDHSVPVAKATILSTDRNKIVGGRELGAECCEVVVDYIMKKDAILPRPVGNITTIGHSQGRAIAWLYKHLEVQK